MQTAVATCDSLSVFMREMEKHPLLSKEEEYALAVRYYENKDLEAANKLVVSNLRFVVKIASEYASYGFPMMDLVQEGSIGLMRAVKKFDPYKGYRLISYAVWWIRVRIQNHIMKFWSNVKIGTTQSQRKLFQRIEGAKRRLGITAARMEDDDISRLADHFGVNEEEISRMQTRVSGRDLSLSEVPPERTRPLTGICCTIRRITRSRCSASLDLTVWRGRICAKLSGRFPRGR